MNGGKPPSNMFPGNGFPVGGPGGFPPNFPPFDPQIGGMKFPGFMGGPGG
jgi:hypothetical protein